MLTYITPLIVAILFCGCSSSTSNNSKVDETQSSIKSKVFGINGKEIVIRSGPGEKYSKVINKKASDILQKVQYAEIDNSVKVEVDSISNNWSKIHVVEPAWLSESHLGWVLSKYIVDESNLAKDSKVIVRKIKSFNDIEFLRQKLSQNGIGNLRKWRSDEMGGYMSITDYFRFGKISAENGMDNNLTYSLLSENETSVRSLELALNINNKDDANNAIRVFKDVVIKTFTSIEMPIPAGLVRSVSNRKSFTYGNTNCKITNRLEKSKIDTWVLLIESN